MSTFVVLSPESSVEFPLSIVKLFGGCFRMPWFLYNPTKQIQWSQVAWSKWPVYVLIIWENPSFKSIFSLTVWHVTLSCLKHMLFKFMSIISCYQKLLTIAQYRFPFTITCSSSFSKTVRSNNTSTAKITLNCNKLSMHWLFMNLSRIFIAPDARFSLFT